MFSKWKNKALRSYKMPSRPKIALPEPVKAHAERIPLSLKITLWYTSFLAFMLFVFSAFAIQFTHAWEYADLKTNLQEEVISASSSINKFKPYHEGVFLIVYTDDGIILRGTIPDGFPKMAAPSLQEISEISVGEQSYYYYDAPIQGVPGLKGYIRGIIPLNQIAKKSNSMVLAFVIGGILLLIVIGWGGFLLVQRSLKPIRTMTRTAAIIGRNNDLSKRIRDIPNSNDEIYALSTTFNDMLDSLEESSKREKRFNSDVSHELRTPISVIQAESEFGKSFITTVDEAKESFENIFKQAKFMTSMVTQLLEAARLDNTKSLELLPLDLSALINETVNNYQRLSKEQQIDLRGQIEPHITVYGDSVLLQRAVNNLVDNAFKFTKSAITIMLTKKESAIQIIVKDNGLGIAPQELPKIWNRLYQIESSRSDSKNKGIGLGLYFVQNVVKLHHGTCSVESTPNKGAQFIIELPTEKT